jgi:hypothetical protein
MLKSAFAALTRNTISLTGTAIALAALVMDLFLFALGFLGFEGGAYIGILTFVILPAVFALGVVMVPVGIWWQHRRERKAAAAGGQIPPMPVFDLNSQHTRNVLLGSMILGLASILILAVGSYKAVHYMDSTAFCGTACHTVMQPEYTAYQRSAHSRVDCADCHIGPGAEWFVKSKLSGAWQLVAVTFDLYPTPIPTPVHSLRPARDTCEQCHWPEKFVGDKLIQRTHFEEDETNTPLQTALLLKVGGQQGNGSTGIHWHVDPGNEVRFLASQDRETIYDIELVKADGTSKLWKRGKDEAPADAEWRVMDCVDCHNRPSHRYRLPQNEIDEAMVDGRIDPSLPFVKREAMRALQVDYDSHEAARAGLSADIEQFYRENYADRFPEIGEQVTRAGLALGDIYAWNVFPKMKVDWGTYPDHSGHEEAPGCFRCHGRRHKTADGDKISRKCETCHVVLAEGEEDPVLLTGLEE